MADEQIGTARIDIIVDSKQARAEIAKAKSQVASMGPEFQKNFATMTKAQQRATVSALKYSQQVGKTRDEIKLLNLAARGAAPEALEKMRQSILANRKATEQMGTAVAETAAQQKARLSEMVRSSMARADADKVVRKSVEATATVEASAGKKAEASAAVRARSAALSKATVKSQIADYAVLDAVMSGNVKSAEEVAAAELALDRLQKRGAITTAELATAFAALNKVTNANTRANVKNAASRKVLNSRAYSELGTAASEIASGNFGQLRRTGAAFLNQAGFFEKLFSPIGLAITGVAASVAALTVSYVKATNANQALNVAMIKSGDASGTTATQVKQLATSFDGISDSKALKMLTEIVASGRVASDQLHEVGQAAIDLATTTDQSVSEATKQILEMLKSPTEGAKQFDEALHTLTVTQMQEIQHLEDMGDRAGASRVLLDALSGSVGKTAEQIKKSLPWYSRLLHTVGQLGSDAFGGIGNMLAGGTGFGVSRALSDDPYEAMQQHMAEAAYDAERLNRAIAEGREGDIRLWGGRLNDVNQAIKSLSASAEYRAAKFKHAQASVMAQTQQDGKEALATLTKLGISLDGVETKQQKVAKAAQALYRVYLAGGKLPEGVSFGGPVADMPTGAGWEKIKAGLLGGSGRSKKSNVTALSLQDKIAKMAAKAGDAAQRAAERATASVAKQNAATIAYKHTLDEMADTRQQQRALEIESLSMGDQQIQQRNEMIRIEREYDRQLGKLARDKALGRIKPEQYDEQLAALDAYYATEKSRTEQHFREMDQVRQSWLVGLTRGLNQVRESGLDQAGQMTNLVTQGFSDMADAVVNFGMTGKVELEDFATNFVKMMLRMEAAALAAQAAQAILGWINPGASGQGTYNLNGSYFSGGSFAGGGTYTGPGAVPGRASGGKVAPHGLYEVAEGGRPELLQVGGRTYLMMGAKGGDVVPSGAAARGTAAAKGTVDGLDIQFNVTNKGDPVQARQTGVRRDGRKVMIDMVLDAVASDTASGGRTAKAMQQRFGLQRVGVPVGG